MGILRVFFALIVLLGHSPASGYLLPIFSGPLAVEAFYIISGFYIQLIIGKYSTRPHWVAGFYSSRLTRIFSTYYLVLIATIAFRVSVGNYPLTTLFHSGHILPIVFSLFMNIFIIGQDVARMVSLDLATGAMHFAPGTLTNEFPLGGFAILGQAWTLAPELLFYFLSPILLRTRSATLAALAVGSLYLKCKLEWNGVNWTATFFPCELGYFLLGAIACRAYARYIRQAEMGILIIMPTILLATAILSASIVWSKIPYQFHNGFTLDDVYKRLAYMLLVAVSLPFIFRVSRQSKLDRAIGELSYPIYLIHLIIIEMLTYFGLHPGRISVVATIISIMTSIPIARYIETPITLYRHRRFLKENRLHPQYEVELPQAAIKPYSPMSAGRQSANSRNV